MAAALQLEWWCTVPFAVLLGCIALCPVLPKVSHLWHHLWFQSVVALGLGTPVGVWMVAAGNAHGVIHSIVEYVQFILLLAALFVVSGGIYVSGDIQASPRNNCLFLGLGAVAASFIGTTGAAMLFLRPLLNTNKERTHRRHTVVFFIFLVANCGGLLTPLGDPPLFLGMLRGVPFMWTFGLFPHWLFVNGLLLLIYYGLDRREYAREPWRAIRRDDTQIAAIRMYGRWNLLWLAGIVASVAFLPSVDIDAFGTNHEWQHLLPIRELVLVGLTGVSLLGNHQPRKKNEFTWGPILEVAALFSGIFLAMIPALGYLRQVAPSLPLDRVSLFLFTGGLSSVLDNAPTYLTFFEMAGTLPGEPRVAGVPEVLLVSISLGAVFFGAMTYIGNGPNFMVKAVAERAGVAMPSFVAYTLIWAARYLLPILVALALCFIAEDWTTNIGGGVLAAGIAGNALYRAHRFRDPKRKHKNE
ncbi:sodium:proton antiporter [Candidatus Peregrinibacteria bacterium]|nr:sodium:proton antiporter [Candidatus Peregrinibacteria bacterium]